MEINYKVCFKQPSTHYATIDLYISDIKENFLELKMPVWIPGSYLVREFSKNIDFLFDVNNQIRLKNKNKNTWIVNTENRKSVHIQYRLYCFEWSVRTNHVNIEHAFLNGAATFLYVNNYQQMPIGIQFFAEQEWKQISTNLNPVGENKWHRIAKNFDDLYDSVFEIGNQIEYYFNIQQTAYTLAIFRNHDAVIEKVILDLRQIIQAQIDIFGQHPCDKYLFIIHHSENAFGGLEHKFSSVNHIPRNYFNNTIKYQQAISLLAHEHFHLWNVKRIKPADFIPFNYEEENYTELLWFFEGITSYYDDLTCYRAGVFTEDVYWVIIEELLFVVENNAGNDVQTLAESSLDTWIKYYRPNENTGNSQVSYYRKGALVALLIDIIIQHYSEKKYSLDNVMKAVFEDTLANNYKGITKEKVLQELNRYAAYNWEIFYKNYIEDIQPLPIKETFELANYSLEIIKRGQKTIGVKLKKQDSRFVVSFIDKNYLKYNFQLQTEDVLLRIDNIELVNDITEIFEQKNIGDVLKILILRDGIETVVEVILAKSIERAYKIAKSSS